VFSALGRYRGSQPVPGSVRAGASLTLTGPLSPQEDNGLPIHLKGGAVDAVLYRATMTLTVLGETPRRLLLSVKPGGGAREGKGRSSGGEGDWGNREELRRERRRR